MDSGGDGANGQGQGDVALLVDWENLKFSLAQRERRPNVTALRNAAERFGRIVYARAYADWQDPVHSGDPASLYMAGLEPVYVLTRRYTESSGEVRIKNSVDVKLAADCIEASHQFPHISTYIIVSGDHGFLHIVNTLRPHGKRVVVIGVSWTTAAALTDQADVVLYYDLDVERMLDETTPVTAPPEKTKKVSPGMAQAAEAAMAHIQASAGGTTVELDQRKVAEVLEVVMEVTREYRRDHRDLSVSLLGQELQKRLPGSDFARLVKGRTSYYVQGLAAHRDIRLVPRGFVDWIYLPDEPDEVISTAAPPPTERARYDYGGLVFADLSEQMRNELISAIQDERLKPGTDYLTFNRIRDVVVRVTGREEFAAKNLVNNMVSITVLKNLGERRGFSPETGAAYSYATFTLDLQNADVRRALHLG